jgi:hypothetical protein
MLSLQNLHSNKVYPWQSTQWPVSTVCTGDNLTISGEVVESFEFQIRKTNELKTNLSYKSGQDVSETRRGIRIKFISAKNNSNNQSLSYTQLSEKFKKFVESTSTLDLISYSISNNTLDIFAQSTVIGDLRSRPDGSPTPLAAGTKLTFLTNGETPFVHSVNITIDKAVDLGVGFADKKGSNKTGDEIEEDLVNFAKKYEQLHGAPVQNAPASDDDEWDY